MSMKWFYALGVSMMILLLISLSVSAQLVEEQWVARFNGPVNSDDHAFAIALDTEGNVYVTGKSVGDGTSMDYATIKYDAFETELWVARYNGPANTGDEAYALAVDAEGNVYITGQSVGSGTGNDYATIKYDTLGTELWVARYNGPANSSDSAYAIAVDEDGNVYVTGRSVGNGTGYDYATIKYDTSGNEKWVVRYNGPANREDRARTLKVDADGNVYVTGRSVGSGTGYDYATVKYDEFGLRKWVARYNGSGNGEDRGEALSVDADGNVYVTGLSIGNGTSYDYATIKYDSSGTEQWVSRYNGPGNSRDYSYALTIDVLGNVYITGQSVGYNSPDYATIKYDALGTELWVARYNGPANGDDRANAIEVDSAGNVYVTGGSQSTVGYSGFDYLTIMYDAIGTEQWVARYNGPANNLDMAYYALVLDSVGNVYVSGQSVGSGTSYDYATIKYSQDSDADGVLDPDDNCPTVPNYDQVDVNEDGYGDACVSPDVIIHECVMIGKSPIIGEGTNFECYVSIGDYAEIGNDAQFKQYATVADNVFIGSECIIEHYTNIGNNVNLGFKVKLEENVIVGDIVQIGAETIIKKSSEIKSEAQIGAFVTIEEDVLIGYRAVIGNYAKIGKGIQIPDDEIITEGATISH